MVSAYGSINKAGPINFNKKAIGSADDALSRKGYWRSQAANFMSA